jgi:release factor glutamine methyltransferase
LTIDDVQLAAYLSLIERRAQGEPVAYLRGHVEWRGLRLEVSPAVLVPRPETELLAEQAIDLTRERELWLLADIGTGSGAIAIALALADPDYRVYAVDYSQEALAVARCNAIHHGVDDRVQLLHGDLLQPLPVRPDLLVANLPYLSDEMMASLPADVRHEPSRALHAGPSGIELYSRLLRQLADHAWAIPLLLEIDPRQVTAMRSLVRGRFPGASFDILPDYAGHDRIMVIRPEGK